MIFVFPLELNDSKFQNKNINVTRKYKSNYHHLKAIEMGMIEELDTANTGTCISQNVHVLPFGLEFFLCGVFWGAVVILFVFFFFLVQFQESATILFIGTHLVLD